MLTKEALAEIEQRHKAATPGPWHADKYNAYIWGPQAAMVADSGGSQGLPAGAGATAAVIRARGVGGGLPIDANMAFISEARTDIPDLLADRRELVAHIAELDVRMERLRLECEGEREARWKLENAYRQKDAAVSALMGVCTPALIDKARAHVAGEG